MAAEKDKSYPLKDRAADTGGDGPGPRLPPPSRTSRVSFSSRLHVQQPQSPAPGARGERPPRHPRLQPSPRGSRSRPSSARLGLGRGQRSGVPSPVPLPPPSNAAARQCRRLRSCVACSGKATPENLLALSSAPPTPASTETEPLLVHQLTQTEPAEPAPAAAQRVDRDVQTESPARQRRSPRVRLFMDRDTQTKVRALPPGAPPGPEPPGRPSLLRRLLRACRPRCTRARPQRPGGSPKRAQHPQAAPQGHTPGIGVLMVLQEPAEGIEWLPNSWPWLIETTL